MKVFFSLALFFFCVNSYSSDSHQERVETTRYKNRVKAVAAFEEFKQNFFNGEDLNFDDFEGVYSGICYDFNEKKYLEKARKKDSFIIIEEKLTTSNSEEIFKYDKKILSLMSNASYGRYYDKYSISQAKAEAHPHWEKFTTIGYKNNVLNTVVVSSKKRFYTDINNTFYNRIFLRKYRGAIYTVQIANKYNEDKLLKPENIFLTCEYNKKLSQ